MNWYNKRILNYIRHIASTECMLAIGFSYLREKVYEN